MKTNKLSPLNSIQSRLKFINHQAYSKDIPLKMFNTKNILRTIYNDNEVSSLS